MKKMIVESYGKRISACRLLPSPAARTTTYRVNKEPVFIDGVLIKEKGSTDETLIEKVGNKSREPLEHVEARIGLEHEEGDRLLKEQADHDGAPLDLRPVLRRRPKAKLKHDQTEDRDRTVTIICTLVRPKRI